MQRKNDVNSINLVIDDVIANEKMIRIRWSSDIRLGQYDIELCKDGSLIGHSESMDSNEDKEFIKKLISLLVDKIEIKS